MLIAACFCSSWTFIIFCNILFLILWKLIMEKSAALVLEWEKNKVLSEIATFNVDVDHSIL